MCVCVYTVTCKHPYTRHSVYISQFSLPTLSPTQVLRFKLGFSGLEAGTFIHWNSHHFLNPLENYQSLSSNMLLKQLNTPLDM